MANVKLGDIVEVIERRNTDGAPSQYYVKVFAFPPPSPPFLNDNQIVLRAVKGKPGLQHAIIIKGQTKDYNPGDAVYFLGLWLDQKFNVSLAYLVRLGNLANYWRKDKEADTKLWPWNKTSMSVKFR